MPIDPVTASIIIGAMKVGGNVLIERLKRIDKPADQITAKDIDGLLDGMTPIFDEEFKE